VDWLVVEDKQDKTGRNNMGIFKKIMKKQPSAKAKGTIRKMLANPVIDPDPKEFAKNFKKPLTPKKAPAKSPSQPNREAMMKNAISNLKTKTPRAIANKTPTAMKPPVISPLSQGPYGRSLKRSSPKPATRTAGSTESVSNQPSVQGAVKRLAKGPGLKKGGSVQKMKRGSSAGGVGNFAKGAARKIYQAKTAPLQVASRLAQRIAPDSLVAGGLRKAASPFKKGGLAIKGQGKAFKNSKR
jgi:hypothetical protein